MRIVLIEMNRDMDVIDHCYTTRAVLREKAREYNIPADKLLIPEDGELIELTLLR